MRMQETIMSESRCVCLFVCVCLSLFVGMCLFTCLCASLCACMSLRFSVFLSLYPSLCLYDCPSVCPSLSVCLSLSPSLPVCLSVLLRTGTAKWAVSPQYSVPRINVTKGLNVSSIKLIKYRCMHISNCV